MSWQNCVLVVLLWPLIGLQKHVHSFLSHILRTAFLRFPARCRLGLCFSVCDQFIQAMKNSNTRVRIVFVYRFHYIFHSVFYLVGNKLLLPIRVQSQCSLESNLLVQMNLRLLAECTHDRPLHEIVRILKCLLSWNIGVNSWQTCLTVVRNPASVQNLLTLSCCDNFSIRSLYLRNRSSSCATWREH